MNSSLRPKNYNYAKGWVRTIVGSLINKESTKMDTDFDNHPNRYTFSTKIKHTSERIHKITKVTNKEKQLTYHHRKCLIYPQDDPNLKYRYSRNTLYL